MMASANSGTRRFTIGFASPASSGEQATARRNTGIPFDRVDIAISKRRRFNQPGYASTESYSLRVRIAVVSARRRLRHFTHCNHQVAAFRMVCRLPSTTLSNSSKIRNFQEEILTIPSKTLCQAIKPANNNTINKIPIAWELSPISYN